MKNNDYDSWLLIIAIGLCFVAFGAIIDFFLKKREVKILHQIFIDFASAIRDIPLQQWQVKIAHTGISFFVNFHHNAKKFFSIELQKKYTEILAYIICILLFISPIVIYQYYNLWYIGAFVLPVIIAFFVMSIDVLLDKTKLRQFFNLPKFNREDHSDLTFTLLIPYISVIMSLLAILIARELISDIYLNTHWFERDHTKLIPTNPILLPTINLVFDFCTIFVTLFLLNLVVKFKKFIGIAAFIDIVLSACLTILLYSTLIMIENDWDFINFSIYIKNSIIWFSKISIILWDTIRNEPLTFNLQNIRDLHLLPLLFTTFIPVFIYMSIFLFLAFGKPVLLISSRFFEVIGERDESVFKQLGVLIATVMAALKAIYDYIVVN